MSCTIPYREFYIITVSFSFIQFRVKSSNVSKPQSHRYISSVCSHQCGQCCYKLHNAFSRLMHSPEDVDSLHSIKHSEINTPICFLIYFSNCFFRRGRVLVRLQFTSRCAIKLITYDLTFRNAGNIRITYVHLLPEGHTWIEEK